MGRELMDIWNAGARPRASVGREASPELHIGMSNNDQGVHINIMQKHADGSVTVIFSGKCPEGDSFGYATLAAAVTPADDVRDAARYRWLRDKSEPGICSFYLSVGQAFKDVKFAPETVDEAIDAAIQRKGQP